MSTTSKLTYLENTKNQIKEALNNLGASIIDSDTFRSYVEKINEIYDDYPKVEGEGNNIELSNTKKGKMLFKYKGYTFQKTTTGKNFFKASSSNYTQGLTITHDTTTGEITFGGTTTGSYPTLSNFTNANVPAGEYTFSIDKALPYNLSLRLVNSNGQHPTTITIPSGSLYASATTSYNAVRLEIVYSINTSGVAVPTTTIKPMLESGPTATSFEPYTNGPSPNLSYPQNIEVVTGTQSITISNEDGTQTTIKNVNLGNIELCKIDTYQDRIYKQNDKWYLEKQIGKIVLNGSETEWSSGGNYNGIYQFDYSNSSIKSLTQDSNVSLYSNYFGTTSTWGNSWEKNNIALHRVNFNRIRYQTSECVTLEQFKAWLNTHNVITYYLLATPTTTEITDSTLLSQLEEVDNLFSFDNVTNIKITGNESVVLNAKALKKFI